MFLAEVPAGLLGGHLLERYCGAEGECDGRRMFAALSCFAALTPLLLWAVPSAFREDETLLLAEANAAAAAAAAIAAVNANAAAPEHSDGTDCELQALATAQ